MSHSESADPPGLPARITDSLAGVWKDYAGAKPTEAETQINGNVIRCVLKDAVNAFDKGIVAAEALDASKDVRQLSASTYRRDAVTAIRRTTRRQVMAFVSDHDSQTDVATEVFILEASPYRPRAAASGEAAASG